MIPLSLAPSLAGAVAGRGEAALKRLEHLRAGGADPLVFSDDPGAELAHAAGDRLVGRLPGPGDLAELRVLYVAGLPEGEARPLAQDARAARVLVNVEDVTELCDFHVPSVVRRGDLLLTASTGGKSPALARRLRRELETLFPPEWAERVEAVARERGRMRAEGFGMAAVARETEALVERRGWLDRGPDLPGFEPGTVWLAGTGPGHAGMLPLMTLKGLREADVVVHDALVGADILDLAGPQARRVDVGKRAGRPSPRQEQIDRELVALARRGLKVLRLKGGDPFVFGRGGEECLALAGAGIPFRVVPAPTAGIGGLAQAGIPATHRGMAGAVTLVTGRDRTGGLPADLDWSALARLPGTLVFYMALGTLDEIAARLVRSGKPPMTPTAIVCAAGTPDQFVVETVLARAASDARRLRPAAPAIIAVGEVVRLRKEIAPWLETGDGRAPVAGSLALGG
jgi:uroporphyrin-III C-methyltransferase